MPTTTNYIRDDDNLLAGTDDSNVVQTIYTNEPEHYGNLISTRNSGTTNYHHFDALGSTRQLTNAAGTITDTMIYDAWGNIVARTGATTLALLWIGQSGYYYNRESLDYYVRTRIFAPSIARWTTPDPIGFVAGINHYVYANGCPVGLTDPTGALSIDHHGKDTTVAAHGECNFVQQVINWKLRPAERNGFILQRVELTIRVLDCAGRFIVGSPKNCPPPGVIARVYKEEQSGTFTYWELWRVDDAGNFFGATPDDKVALQDTDTFGFNLAQASGGKLTCGTYSQFGESFWLAGNDPPGGWDAWKYNPKIGFTGDLPWRCDGPDFDRLVATGANHALDWVWNCCDEPHKERWFGAIVLESGTVYLEGS